MKIIVGLILMLFIANGSFGQSADSLLNVAKNSPDDQKAIVYNQLAKRYRTSDSAKTIFYAKKALSWAQKHNQAREIGLAYFTMGDANYYASSFQEGKKYYKLAEPFFIGTCDTAYLIETYNSLGLVDYYLNQNQEALMYYFKGLELCRSEKTLESKADFYTNIAMVHRLMENHQEAINYYYKSYKINKQIHDTASIAVNFNNIASAYQYSGKLDSAKYYFRKSLNLFQKQGNRVRESIALSNIAVVFFLMNDSLDKALDYQQQAALVFNELNDNRNIAYVEQSIGSIYSKMGKYPEAIEHLTQSLELTKRFNLGFEILKINYEALSEVYEKKGNFQEALKYYKLFSMASDSLLNQEKMKQITSLEKQYETARKEAEIQQLQSEKELAEVEIRKNKLIRQLGFVVIMLLLVLVFYISVRYFDRQKSNRLLMAQNRKIEKSERELQKLNAAKNKFFSIIAHDLKNPFHTVMGYSYLLHNEYDEFTEEERRKYAGDIYLSANNILRLLQNLLDWARSQTGRLTYNPQPVRLERIYENAISVLSPVAEQKQISLSCQIDESLIVFADPLMMETVFRNLINNAIKFTHEGGWVNISASSAGPMAEICVADNGTGISSEDQKNMFRIDSKVKRRGTSNEDGSGLGLILCQEFIEKHGGKIRVESEPGQGSRFFFTVPLSTRHKPQKVGTPTV